MSKNEEKVHQETLDLAKEIDDAQQAARDAHRHGDAARAEKLRGIARSLKDSAKRKP